MSSSRLAAIKAAAIKVQSQASTQLQGVKCKHCPELLSWRVTPRIGSKPSTWTPIGLDGFDHRETCAGMRQETRDQVRDDNHEDRVTAFFARIESEPPASTGTKNSPFPTDGEGLPF